MPLHPPALDDRSSDDLVSDSSSPEDGSPHGDKLTFAETPHGGGAVGLHEITDALIKINLIDADGASDNIEIYEIKFGTQVGSEGVVARNVDHIDELQSGGSDDFF